MPQPFSFEQFRAVACVALGGVSGALISLPVALQAPSGLAGVIPIGAIVMGALSGYRHRKSSAFFYFSLFCVCVLSAVIASSGFESATPLPQ